MYAPRLRDDLVKRLYVLCQRLEVPMTHLVNGALEQAVQRAEEGLALGGKGRVLEEVGLAPACAVDAADRPAAVAAG